MSEGKLCEMQADNNYSIYQVKYDYNQDKDTGVNK